MKKYNNQTGCYKIDLFINGCYICSTDQAATCKQAKQNWLKYNKIKPGEKLTAHFFNQ